MARLTNSTMFNVANCTFQKRQCSNAFVCIVCLLILLQNLLCFVLTHTSHFLSLCSTGTTKHSHTLVMTSLVFKFVETTPQ